MATRRSDSTKTDIKFRPCNYCGKTFATRKHAGRVSCSDECKRHLYARTRENYQPRRRCRGCVNTITASEFSQGKRFCTDGCAQLFRSKTARAKSNKLARQLIGSLRSCTRCERYFAGRRILCYSCRAPQIPPATGKPSLGVGICKCGRRFDRILAKRGRCLHCEQKAKRKRQ